MNALKRSGLYTMRKIGRSIVLFLLLFLITTLVTAGFFTRDAAQEAAAGLRETTGASFSIQGRADKISLNEEGTDYTVEGPVLTRHMIEFVMDCGQIKAYNAVQTASACPGSLVTLSGLDYFPVSANTETKWNNFFSNGTLSLTEGNPITASQKMSAVISGAAAAENNLSIGDDLVLYPYPRESPEKPVCLKIAGLYESRPDMEFNDDTVFITHNAYWKLTGKQEQTYSGKTSFIVKDPRELDNIINTVRENKSFQWDRYKFSKSSDRYEAVSYQLSTMEHLTTVVTGASAVISGILLFLILVMGIRNRVQEAGMMLAVGISKSSIIIQYIMETAMLMVLSSAASFIVCKALAGWLTSYLHSFVSGIAVTVLPMRLLAQYLIEAGIIGAAVIIAAMPVIRLNPKDILSRMN